MLPDIHQVLHQILVRPSNQSSGWETLGSSNRLPMILEKLDTPTVPSCSFLTTAFSARPLHTAALLTMPPPTPVKKIAFIFKTG